MHKFKDNEGKIATFDKVWPILHERQTGWEIADEAKVFAQLGEIS